MRKTKSLTLTTFVFFYALEGGNIKLNNYIANNMAWSDQFFNVINEYSWESTIKEVRIRR